MNILNKINRNTNNNIIYSSLSLSISICPKCDNSEIKFEVNDSVDSILVGLSVDKYRTKEDARAGISKMKWKNSMITLDDLGYELSSGKTYCNIFNTNNKGIVTSKLRRNDNFVGSQVITIDVDDTNLTCKEFVDKLSIKPSLIIPSYSNLKEKNGKVCERFHLLYCFDKLLNSQKFITISNLLVEKIKEESGEEVDNCSKVLSQYYNGNSNYEYTNNNIIYSSLSLSISICPKCDNSDNKPQTEIEVGSTAYYLLRDIDRMDYKNLVHNYSWIGYNYRSNIEFDKDELFKKTDNNYIEVLFNKNKKDGTKRRRFIYINMLLRKLIEPTISLEKLIYCAYMDVNFHKMVDNSDNVFNSDYYERNAISAFDMSIDEIKKNYSEVINTIQTNKPSIVISDNFKNKKNAGEIHKLVRKNVNDEIKKNWDNNKSVEENRNNLKSLGIEVSERTLRRLGLGKKKNKEEKVKSLIDINLSVLGNQKLLKEKGINISRTKLSNIIKSIKDNNTNNINSHINTICPKCDSSDNTNIESEYTVPEFGFDFWFNRESEPEVVDNRDEEIVIDSNIEYNFSGFSLSNL